MQGPTSVQMYLSQNLPQAEGQMFTRGSVNVIPDDPAKGRTRPEAKEIADRGRVGSGIAELLRGDQLQVSGTQIQALSAASRSRKSRNKNFVARNKYNIEKLQVSVQSEKEKLAEAAALAKSMPKTEKYKHIGAKVQHRSQSAGRIKSLESININGETSKGDVKRPSTAQQATEASKNFIKRNISSASSLQRLKKSPSASELEKLHRKKEEMFQKTHKPGSVPKYLTALKEEQMRTVETDVGEDDDCPPGHVPMPHEEKIKTLEKLQLAQKEVTSKLNSLPVRSDTLFLQKKKAYLQKQLEEIEEAIKIFSRPKVFVKNDNTN